MKRIKELEEIEVIRVNNSADVLKAADLLETVCIHIFSSKKMKTNFINNSRTVIDGIFLVKNKDWKHWGIQSHYIGDGISVDELEQKIEEILEVYPNIKVSMEGVDIMTGELSKVKVSLAEIEIPILRSDGKYFEEYNQRDIENIKETISEIKEKIETLRLMLL
jgi:hypothetical protein